MYDVIVRRNGIDYDVCTLLSWEQAQEVRDRYEANGHNAHIVCHVKRWYE